LEEVAQEESEAPMKLVRSVKANGRLQDIAESVREALRPVLGDALAREVANNAAMAFLSDDDEIYEPDMTLAEVVRETLAQRMRHQKTYRAEHLTPEMIDEAVEAIEKMDRKTDDLEGALASFFSSPINEHKTPYVAIPEDFTPEEQGLFVDLVREPRFVSRDEQVAKLKEIIARRPEKPASVRRPSDWVSSRSGGGRMKRNSSKRASTLNGRPSMDTRHVGRDIDPDRYTGARGKAIDSAMDRYQTFHAKRPLRTVELPHELPKSVVPVGQVISTMYRTDKWHEDGDDEDYKHVHDNSRGGKEREYEFGKGVIAYEPAHQVNRSRIENRTAKNFAGPTPPTRLPVRAPGALSLLGYCLGVFVQRFDDEEVYEVNPRGCYLFCSPKGDMLALYSPEKQPDGSVGFLMVMAGGGLRVLKDGIDG
jgi:hypothetical protein